MKINIGFTGISGMLGKNFLDFYLNNKQLHQKFNIIGFTRKEDLNFKNEYQKEDGSIIIKTIDYNRLDNIKESLKSVDILIHAAGVTKAYSYKQFYEGNCIVTLNLINVIKNENLPIKRFIYISSQSVLGPSQGTFNDEQSQYNPISSYGKSKEEAEKLVKNSNLDWLIIRYPAIFGKYDLDSLMLFKIASKSIIIDTSWKEYILSYIFAEDAVRLVFNLIENNKIKSKILHFCYDDPIKIRDFQKSIIDITYKDKKRFILKLLIPKIVFKIAAIVITLISKLNKKPNLVNTEKLEEFLNTSWLLSNNLTKEILNIDSIVRKAKLEDIINWYKKEGLV